MPQNLILVDCEARGTSPVRGTMTEFGAVHYDSGDTFHGVLFEGKPDPLNPAVPIVLKRVAGESIVATMFSVWIAERVKGRASMASDNPAFDFMWIAALFDAAGMDNPFGHSARRISDFFAGLTANWGNTQDWKRWRVTPHDHNPVHDCQGNAEALRRIFQLAAISRGMRDLRAEMDQASA